MAVKFFFMHLRLEDGQASRTFDGNGKKERKKECVNEKKMLTRCRCRCCCCVFMAALNHKSGLGMDGQTYEPTYVLAACHRSSADEVWNYIKIAHLVHATV